LRHFKASRHLVRDHFDGKSERPETKVEWRGHRLDSRDLPIDCHGISTEGTDEKTFRVHSLDLAVLRRDPFRIERELAIRCRTNAKSLAPSAREEEILAGHLDFQCGGVHFLFVPLMA
jgi:hypothetical protein